ncbi:MAG TPA: PEP-CTERM sorting domain-containing protein [Opitutaceae bacterium]
MKSSRFLPAFATLGLFIALPAVHGQSTLANWTFTDVADGTKTGIAATSSVAGIELSTLSERLSASGTANTAGVVSSLIGPTVPVSLAGSSATFDGKAFEITMTTTRTMTDILPSAADDYSLSFSVTPGAGSTLQLTGLSIDFGYDTSLTTATGNYVRPNFQLYYSLDGITFTPIGGYQQPGIVGGTQFNATAGHYIKDDISISFDPTTGFSTGGLTVDGGEAISFRIAIAENSNSGSASRRVLLDDIKLLGTVTTSAIPEPSTYAAIVGALALGAVIARRRRQR